MLVKGPINGIYLSGWEYNRLLQKDPLQSRNSALPAEALWNGAAQLWLFEHVYVTAEALENELYAAERLSWPTGAIFGELAAHKDEIVVPVRWKRDLRPETQALLRQNHPALRQKYSSGIKRLIREGRELELESIKQELIAPITAELDCFSSVSPNSIRNWMDSTSASGPEQIQVALQSLSDPIRPGFDLLRPPGSGVTERAKAEQARVQQAVEAPMIPALLAGTGDFKWSSNDGGHVPYIEALRPYREAYEPINRQMAEDWERNRNDLLDLRRAARQHLWPRLHGDWLPRLVESDGAFAPEFVRLVGDALQIHQLASRLRKPAKWTFALAGGAAVAATLTRSAPLEPLLKALGELGNSTSGDAVAMVVATLGGLALGYGPDVTERLSLALFYQRASRR